MMVYGGESWESGRSHSAHPASTDALSALFERSINGAGGVPFWRDFVGASNNVVPNYLHLSQGMRDN